MAIQTIQFDTFATAELTGSIAAYLLDGSDTALASLTETSPSGRWTGTLTDHAAGDFELVITDDSGVLALYWVRLLADAGTYPAVERWELTLETLSDQIDGLATPALDAAALRAALGMSSADLDDQLAAIIDDTTIIKTTANVPKEAF